MKLIKTNTNKLYESAYRYNDIQNSGHTLLNRLKLPIAAYFIIIACFVSCAPYAVITASWKSPGVSIPKYNRILLAALTTNTIAKVTLENEVAAVLINQVQVLKSLSKFPPDIHNNDSDKETIMKNVKNKNVNAILTISLLNKETETRYIPRPYSYNSLFGYNYYDNFWGYYSYRYPYSYDPGYYVQDKIYFLETNLYDVSTEKLVWSAQSRTYNPSDLQTFTREFAIIIVRKMKTDRVLNEMKNIPTAR